MAEKTTSDRKLEHDTVPAHAEAAGAKAAAARIDVGHWIAELKSDPDRLRDLLHGVELKHVAKQFPSLALETRATLPTPEAAYHLNRAQQTLRLWASEESGPLRPLRINGRLAWPVAELRRVLGVPA